MLLCPYKRAKMKFQVLLLVFLYMRHKDSEVHGGRESISAPHLSNEGTREACNITQTENPLAVYCQNSVFDTLH